jgi:xanthine dehydrogenase accessory factor
MSKEISNGMTSMMSWIDALNMFEAKKEPYAIATVVKAESPSSGKPGDKAVVSADGQIFGWIGGGCAQPVITKAVKDALGDGKPLIVRISPSTGETITANGVRDVHMACHSGGSLELLVEPRLHKQAILVIGSTPVAEKLEFVGPFLSMPIKRCEPGTEVEGSYPMCVVATQGKKDKDSLKIALLHTHGAVFFVASEKKAAKLKEQLITDGLDTTEIDRIFAPAGVEVGAVTTDEIVVSILAGLVKQGRYVFPVIDNASEQVA